MATLLTALFFPSGAHAAPDCERRDAPAVLIELFTSQGCSSCPPADRLLAELAREGCIDGVTVIPLAFHVDYWNRLGWEDPHSSSAWSSRQHDYALAMGLEVVYTPQMVLNGRRQVVGSDESAIRHAIHESTPENPPWDIQLGFLETRRAGTLRLRVAISTPPNTLGSSILGMVALFQDGLVTPVARGENARRTLENERVVRQLHQVLELGPNSRSTVQETVDLPLAGAWPTEDLGVAFFLQDPSSMEVLGAAAIRLVDTTSP